MSLFAATSRQLKPTSKGEVERVLELPVREPPNLREITTPDWLEQLKRPGTEWSFRPVQTWALEEIRSEESAVLLVGVGHGKTLVTYCAPAALGIDPEEVLVLLPANLRETFRVEGAKYHKELCTPQTMRCMSYTELSMPSGQGVLAELSPKVIICDEAHYLRNSKATRTRRFLHFLEGRGTQLVLMSGTMLSRSILDGQRLIGEALGKGAPIPQSWSAAQSWANAVDEDVRRWPNRHDWRRIDPLVDRFAPDGVEGRVERARAAFHRRLVTTPGVVHTTTSSAQQPIHLHHISPWDDASVMLSSLASELEASWTRPDGELLEDDMRVAECARQLSLGFYYTWDWGPAGKDEEWNKARLSYQAEVRAYLKRFRQGRDSPALVRRALLAGAEGLPDSLVEAFHQWWPIRDRADPQPEPVIETTAILERVLNFARDLGPDTLVWYTYRAEAQVLAQLGAQVCLPGEQPRHHPTEPLCVSIRSHSDGQNLQAWNKNVVSFAPSSGKTWEQLIGRTHRPGQEADRIEVYVCTHDPRHRAALRKAQREAEFAHQTTGQPQKLAMSLEHEKVLDI